MRRAETGSLEKETNVGGKYSFVNMMNPSIGNPHAVNHVLLEEFKIPDDVKMYILLLCYGDFRGLDLPGGADLAAISNRIYEGIAKPSLLTLKHHLLLMHMHKKLFTSHNRNPLK